MAIQAHLAASRAGNRRSSARRTLHLQSTLGDGGDGVIIHDISHNGLLLETTTLLADGETLDVELPEVGLVRAKIVWRSSRFIGCRLTKPLSKAAVSAALLRNPFEPAELVGIDEERAWEKLGGLCGAPEQRRDPDAPSAATKVTIIVGASLLLWAVILWGVGIF